MRRIESHQRNRRHGLTLIELVLVVAVLAILAGFIVPRLGLVRNLAGDAGNATTVADATNQSVLYNTVVGHYPDGEDSLIGATGAIDTRLNGGLQTVLQTHTLTANEGKSLVAQITGLSANSSFGPGQVNLWSFADTATVDPNLDDTIAAPITYDFTAKTVTGVIAEVTPGVTATNTIYQAAYPGALLNGTTATGFTPNDGSILVAIGYGAQSAINGKTGLEPPVLFDKTPGEYTRPIFLLKLWSVAGTPSEANPTPVPAGTSASTSISLSYDGTPVSSNLAKYKVDQNR